LYLHILFIWHWQIGFKMYQATIGVQSGWVTAAYFVFIELILERIVIFMGSRSNDSRIKRRILSGERVTLQEKEVPIITENLVSDGNRAEWLTICVFRAIFLVAILLLNLGTNGEDGGLYKMQRFKYWARSEMSDAQWNKNGTYHFKRDFNLVANCKIQDDSANQTKYYRMAFNAVGKTSSDQVDFEEGTKPFQRNVTLDTSSVACLDGISYTPEVLVFALGGCGSHGFDCIREIADTPIYQTKAILWSKGLTMKGDNNSTDMSGNKYATLKISLTSWVNCLYRDGNPSLQSCVLTVRQDINPKYPSVKTVDIYMVDIAWCSNKLGLNADKGTESNYSFTYPRKGGYIFHTGEPFENITILHALKWLGADSPRTVVDLAGQIYAQSIIFESVPSTAVIKRREKQLKVTKINVIALVGFGLLAVSALATMGMLLAVVAGRQRKDLSIRLNRFGGVSSMLREERNPTEVSGKRGAAAVVGLMLDGTTATGRRLRLRAIGPDEKPCDFQDGDVIDGGHSA
jgi:hypothetical protein